MVSNSLHNMSPLFIGTMSFLYFPKIENYEDNTLKPTQNIGTTQHKNSHTIYLKIQINLYLFFT